MNNLYDVFRFGGAGRSGTFGARGKTARKTATRARVLGQDI